MEIKKSVVALCRVLATNLRFACGKVVHRGNFKYSPVTCLALSDEVAISGEGSVDFGKGLRTRGRCRFNVQGKGKLCFGNNVFINSGCQFNCRDEVRIGDGVEFGPNVLVYDHDHDIRATEGLKGGAFVTGEVIIGTNCWIGAGSIILRGTVIGEGTTVAAGCILKGEYPASSIIVQKRATDIVSI